VHVSLFGVSPAPSRIDDEMSPGLRDMIDG
jgi:hypothetical protein